MPSVREYKNFDLIQFYNHVVPTGLKKISF
jgi:hypothetical protein